MTSSDGENDCSDSENEKLLAEIEGLQTALSVARETLGEIRSSGSLARAQAEALRVDLELREDEIASLRADHRAALARASLAEAELSEAQSAIDANLATLAGRDREMSLRDAHVAVAERGIEDRDQQLTIFCKELDHANEQLSLFEGEIQTQRAMLESARQAVALRDDRIAFLQATLRSLEQLASGAAGAEALPRPQVASLVPLAPVAAAAPAPKAAVETPRPDSPVAEQPVSAEVAGQNVVESQPVPAPAEVAGVAEVPDAEAPSADQAAPAEVAPQVEPASGDDSDPVAVEPEVNASEPAAEDSSAKEAESAVESETPAAAPAPAATEETEETTFYFKEVPPLIPPAFRYWRDTEIERSHPDEAIVSLDTLFLKYVEECCQSRQDDTIHIWCLGGGDTQLEVRIAALLNEHHIENFEFHILDSQPKKLKKQRTMLVNGLELGEKFDIQDGDLANWPEDAPCDFVIADGSISLAKDPEALLDKIQALCESGAVLLMADRIGSSTGFPPSAMAAIGEVFGPLTEKQRKNKVEGAVEDQFVDRRSSQDDSTTQRLVALLEARLEFEVMLTAGNLIEALVGPEFGPNFKVKEADDCKIIDDLAVADRGVMSSEGLEPRFLVAVLRKGGVSERLLLGCANTA